MSCALTPMGIAATGSVRAAPGVVSGIHGVVSTAGALILRDGGASGAIRWRQPLAVGPVTIDPSGVVRFSDGIYAEFASGLVADLVLFLG